MKKMIEDFKSIMQDKHERREFIGGGLCFMAMMFLAYCFIVIFG